MDKNSRRINHMGSIDELQKPAHGNTIKASNFGPFLARSVASFGESFTENEQNRVCKSKVFLQPSLPVRRVLIIARPSSGKKSAKFTRGSKLEALTASIA
jgi:hypothetical protein